MQVRIKNNKDLPYSGHTLEVVKIFESGAVIVLLPKEIPPFPEYPDLCAWTRTLIYTPDEYEHPVEINSSSSCILN